MGYVYRYTDLSDDIIKYVGIVYSDNRTLDERIMEHESDDWCKCRRWKIEYINENIVTRTDAEYFEAHYISLFNTDKYFNVKKAGWGISSFLPNRENDWILYRCEYANDKSTNGKLLNRKLKECQNELLDTKKQLIECNNRIELLNSHMIERLDSRNANIRVIVNKDFLSAINYLISKYNYYNSFSEKSGVKASAPYVLRAVKMLLVEKYDIDGRVLKSYFDKNIINDIEEITEADVEKMLNDTNYLFTPIIRNNNYIEKKGNKGYLISVTFYCNNENIGTYTYNSISEFCTLYSLPTYEIVCGTILYQDNAVNNSFYYSRLDVKSFIDRMGIKNFYVINNIDRNLKYIS